MTLIYKLFKKIFSNLFYFIDLIVPKNNEIVIFASQRGERYVDNSRYLFLNFIKKYNDEFKIFWVTKNNDTYKKVRKETSLENVIHNFSLKGIILILRAKNIFVSYSLERDIANLKLSNKKRNIIQLWHGIPIKKLVKLDKKYKEKNKKGFVKRETSNYTYVTVSSDIERYVIASCFGMEIEDVKVTGIPRNDYLIKNRKPKKVDNYLYKNKIILYAPTFRDEGKTRFFPFEDYDIQKINNFLERNNAYLLLRGHATDNIFRNSKLNYKTTDRIKIANQKQYEDVQDLLPYVDILITDFSSIYFDYLLLNKPIIFIPYDLDNFKQKRGLLYEYNMITPGPKVNSQKDLLIWLNKYIKNNKIDRKKRNDVKKWFHKYEDGKSYERIYRLIKG